ncbi:uncharacterized protein LOC108597356 isoform X2 [Drosophila busckii]|uniref:uncharacterized protein LOC108597356 isoform X2 n=1 Tax=Drosophila busckii TaxID=30019 RepID=UPI00083F03AC|nr:uncharacterized protein LOC108597356 isoform X2 [Drosophila busckii]
MAASNCVDRLDNEVVYKLIRLYRANDCLWNPSSPGYYNMPLKESAWTRIASYFENNMTVDEVKMQILSLRYYFDAERLNIERNRLQGYHYASQFPFYEELEFLKMIDTELEIIEPSILSYKDQINNIVEESYLLSTGQNGIHSDKVDFSDVEDFEGTDGSDEETIPLQLIIPPPKLHKMRLETRVVSGNERGLERERHNDMNNTNYRAEHSGWQPESTEPKEQQSLNDLQKEWPPKQFKRKVLTGKYRKLLTDHGNIENWNNNSQQSNPKRGYDENEVDAEQAWDNAKPKTKCKPFYKLLSRNGVGKLATQQYRYATNGGLTGHAPIPQFGVSPDETNLDAGACDHCRGMRQQPQYNSYDQYGQPQAQQKDVQYTNQQQPYIRYCNQNTCPGRSKTAAQTPRPPPPSPNQDTYEEDEFPAETQPRELNNQPAYQQQDELEHYQPAMENTQQQPYAQPPYDVEDEYPEAAKKQPFANAPLNDTHEDHMARSDEFATKEYNVETRQGAFRQPLSTTASTQAPEFPRDENYNAQPRQKRRSHEPVDDEEYEVEPMPQRMYKAPAPVDDEEYEVNCRTFRKSREYEPVDEEYERAARPRRNPKASDIVYRYNLAEPEPETRPRQRGRRISQDDYERERERPPRRMANRYDDEDYVVCRAPSDNDEDEYNDYSYMRKKAREDNDDVEFIECPYVQKKAPDNRDRRRYNNYDNDSDPTEYERKPPSKQPRAQEFNYETRAAAKSQRNPSVQNSPEYRNAARAPGPRTQAMKNDDARDSTQKKRKANDRKFDSDDDYEYARGRSSNKKRLGNKKFDDEDDYDEGTQRKPRRQQRGPHANNLENIPCTRCMPKPASVKTYPLSDLNDCDCCKDDAVPQRAQKNAYRSDRPQRMPEKDEYAMEARPKKKSRPQEPVEDDYAPEPSRSKRKPKAPEPTEDEYNVESPRSKRKTKAPELAEEAYEVEPRPKKKAKEHDCDCSDDVDEATRPPKHSSQLPKQASQKESGSQPVNPAPCEADCNVNGECDEQNAAYEAEKPNDNCDCICAEEYNRHARGIAIETDIDMSLQDRNCECHDNENDNDDNDMPQRGGVKASRKIARKVNKICKCTPPVYNRNKPAKNGVAGARTDAGKHRSNSPSGKSRGSHRRHLKVEDDGVNIR